METYKAGTHSHSSGDGKFLGQSIISVPTALVHLYIAEGRGQERGKLCPHLGEEQERMNEPCQDLLSGLVHSQGQSHRNLNSPKTTSRYQGAHMSAMSGYYKFFINNFMAFM